MSRHNTLKIRPVHAAFLLTTALLLGSSCAVGSTIARSQDSNLEKVIHATAWSLLIYGWVGEQLFEVGVEREMRSIQLKRDF